MTRDPDLISLIEDYLDDFEGNTPLPDATRDAIRARLPSISQRPAWWPGWRFLTMNSTTKYALGVAAAVLVATVGITVVGGPAGTNGNSDSTASPTPTPSPAPLPPSGSALEPGRYWLQVVGSPMTATFAATDGWNSQGWYIEQPDHGMQLTIWKVERIYIDACKPELGAVQASEMSVDDLVQALDDQVSTELSEPRDVVVDGYDGVRVELGTSDGVDPAACRGQSLRAWIGGTTRSDSGHDALWILDVNGDTVIVLAAYELGDPAAEGAAQEIVDSIEFDEL